MSKKGKPDESDIQEESKPFMITPAEVNKRDTPAIVTVNNLPLAKLLNIKPGAKIPVPCKNGVPLLREWRNRFRDTKIDKCITVCQNVGKPKEIIKGGE